MKLFVWDFHGVLEKGNDNAVLEITNIALEQHGYSRRMTDQEAWMLSGRHWHEYFSWLLGDLAGEKCMELQATCFKISQGRPEIIAKYIQINEHADFVLSSIQNSPHQQILISNTVPKSLNHFVEVVGIAKYFPLSHRFGVDAHNQKAITKKHCLAEFLKNGNPYESIISIGDSPGDMALLDLDLPFQGVGYLYSHPDRQHRTAKSHYKINDLRHVLQEISTS